MFVLSILITRLRNEHANGTSAKMERYSRNLENARNVLIISMLQVMEGHAQPRNAATERSCFPMDAVRRVANFKGHKIKAEAAMQTLVDSLNSYRETAPARTAPVMHGQHPMAKIVRNSHVKIMKSF